MRATLCYHAPRPHLRPPSPGSPCPSWSSSSSATTRGTAWTRACARSMRRRRAAATRSWWSTTARGTAASPAVRTAWPAVRVIDAGRNLGYAAANNAAIRATDSELLLLLNSDTVVPPGAVDRLITQLRVRAEAAAVGPRLTDADGNVELSGGPPVTPWSASVAQAAGSAAGPPRARAVGLDRGRRVPRAVRRLAERRLPARAPRGRARRRAARRALLPLLRGRGLLPRAAAARPPDAFRPRGHGGSTTAAARGRASPPARGPPTAAASSPSTASTIRRGFRCCASTCAPGGRCHPRCYSHLRCESR